MTDFFVFGLTRPLELSQNTAIQKSFILCYDTSALASVHFPTRIRLGAVIQILLLSETDSPSLLPRFYFCFFFKGSIFPFLLYEILLLPCLSLSLSLPPFFLCARVQLTTAGELIITSIVIIIIIIISLWAHCWSVSPPALLQL